MRDARGFTLHELVIAMFVAAIVSLAGWNFYSSQLRSLTDQAAELEAAEATRSAMSFMIREIRLAGLDPMQAVFTAGGGIDDAGPTFIEFRADQNKNGAIEPSTTDPEAERYRYDYDPDAQQITRTVAGDTHMLIPDVPPDGFVLRYFDRNGNELVPAGSPASLTPAQRDQVAVVLITLRVRVDTVRPTTMALSSRVALRNRVLDRL